ncbi:peptidoglycan recognition protein 5 [Denticeps clupeoides]|uniref:Peptidoglycan recognition protein 1 n=1 Tax=Denticeps clupeoides TaxID=299321 RepID=A0AAY4EBI1_9TELE|nr:peptidoglycan-recognition protein SC1a/b-like [Denticeps clupeoides]
MEDAGGDGEVTLVSRAQWGARDPQTRESVKGPVSKVIVHHTALSRCETPQASVAQLRSIQRVHMEERRFHDVAYNFLVGGDGVVYEGRGWGAVGAHTMGHNVDSVGIAVMGNFKNESASPDVISSIRQLLRSGVALEHLHPNYTVSGHRDFAMTECPGKALYCQLKGLQPD